MSAAARTLLRWVRAVTRRVRLRRALIAASVAATAACAAGVFRAAAYGFGLETPWTWNGTELALAGSIAMFLAIPIALLAPVRTGRVVSLADRRSDLDGALVASVEMIGSDEPIGRLLVRRTAERVGQLATAQVVPLSRPWSAAGISGLALLLVAALLPAAGTSAGGKIEAAGDDAVAALSARLREAAATIVSDVDIPAAERSALARRVLDVEAGLLGGTVGSEDAGRMLGALEGAFGNRYSGFAKVRPAAVAERHGGGTDDSVTTRDNASGESPFSGARGDAGYDGGGGPGAGTGGAEFGADAPGAGDRTRATAEWTLPRALDAKAAARAGTRGPGGDGDAAVHVDVASAQLKSVEPLLTREERALVEAYMDRLRGLTRDDPATTRR